MYDSSGGEAEESREGPGVSLGSERSSERRRQVVVVL